MAGVNIDGLVSARVPGLAIATLDAGGIIATGTAGYADARTRPYVTDATVFQAASLGKMLTAWAVLAVAERRLVDLDAPVLRYLQRYRLPSAPFDDGAVTIRLILSHRAGLSVPDYPGFAPASRLPTLEESLRGECGEVAAVAVIQRPGAAFHYSGGGYTLLQLLIEEVTGTGFAAFTRRHVLQPLGLNAATFEPPTRIAPPLATGHDAAGAALPFYVYRASAAAGLLATAGDLARLLAAYVAGPNGEPPGRGIISPHAIALMTEPVAQTGRADGLWAGYGLGHEVEDLPSGVRLVGHHGVNRGWRALAALAVERRIGFVALANSDSGEAAIEQAFARWRADNGI